MLLPFGGNLSVRKSIDSKTVIFVGQDEAIFKQFLYLHKVWVGPNGERALLPKDEGTGLMISTFISREHGFIRQFSPEILAQVNLRRGGEQYADQDAAIEMYGSPDKRPFTLDKSPFLVFLNTVKTKKAIVLTATWCFNLRMLSMSSRQCIRCMISCSYLTTVLGMQSNNRVVLINTE